MDHFVQMLKESVLFSNIPEEVIEAEILPMGRIRDIPKDGHLIRFQERFDFFGIVGKGKLNLMHIYSNGNYAITEILETSDLFGIDLACTKSRIAPYYAMAVQQTQVLAFPSDLILEPGGLREEIRLRVLKNMLAYIGDENMRKEYRLAILKFRAEDIPEEFH